MPIGHSFSEHPVLQWFTSHRETSTDARRYRRRYRRRFASFIVLSRTSAFTGANCAIGRRRCPGNLWVVNFIRYRSNLLHQAPAYVSFFFLFCCFLWRHCCGTSARILLMGSRGNKVSFLFWRICLENCGGVKEVRIYVRVYCIGLAIYYGT